MANKKVENKSFIEKYKKAIIAIAIALVLVIGGTYAWLQLTLTGQKTTRLEAGTLALTLDESASEGINITDAVPMADTEGLKTLAYTFSLQNTGSIDSVYTIYLDDAPIGEDDTLIADNKVKFSLTKNGGSATTALVSTLQQDSKRVLDTGTKESNTLLKAGVTNTYTLRLWIDEGATNSDVLVENEDNTTKGKVFSVKLRVEAGQVKE